jgi:hypothetical protein
VSRVPGRAARVIALVGLVTASAWGCRGGDFYNENDRLREEVLDLRERVEELRAEREELAAKLAERRRLSADSIPEEALAAMPRLAGVRIGRFSGPRDADGSSGLEVMDVYLEPFDGRRRFLQITARVSAEVFLLGPVSEGGSSGDRSVRRLGRAEFSAEEVREAFRSSLLSGAHYTLEVPLERALEAGHPDLLVRVEARDLLSGRIHRAERVVGARALRGAEDEGAGSRGGG